MKTRTLFIGAAILGMCAGIGLLLLAVFGSLILFLITYHLFADGEAARRMRYGELIAPYWIFMTTLYMVVIVHALNSYTQSIAATSSLLLLGFGVVLGLIVYGLKKLFRAYAFKTLRQPQSLEG
ncbi:MAG: hypothetical protein KA731_02480 [Candidatus Moranbacteria bacterium]|nr:hypothetical protein [Candidatus Moranbacteria bacterium]MBP6034188.1 hypothetical protein [Candidatus Moranbacteria bacterium]